MKPKVLPVLEECVEVGVRLGYNRAHKHVENPSIETISDHISTSIMNEICDRFDFD